MATTTSRAVAVQTKLSEDDTFLLVDTPPGCNLELWSRPDRLGVRFQSLLLTGVRGSFIERSDFGLWERLDIQKIKTGEYFTGEVPQGEEWHYLVGDPAGGKQPFWHHTDDWEQAMWWLLHHRSQRGEEVGALALKLQSVLQVDLPVFVEVVRHQAPPFQIERPASRQRFWPLYRHPFFDY